MLSDTPADPRIAQLRRRKQIAAALLVFATAVLLAAHLTQQHIHHWSLALLEAMAEAALVGGLADWFAVVALFRHPLGQRWIPHTAIIPTRKDAIGESLADFVCNHFLGREQVAHKLRELDIGTALARKLADPATARRVARAVTRALPRLLGVLSDEKLHRFVHDLARDKLRSVDLSGLAALGLDRLTADGRHQALVTDVLRVIAEKLESPEIQEEVKTRVGRQLGRVVSWLGVDSYATGKLISGGIELVQEMAADPDHEVRRYVDAQVHALIARLRTDEKLRHDIEDFRDGLLQQEAFGDYLRGLLNETIAWVEADAAREDSAMAAKMEGALREIGGRLLEDAAMRDWISATVRGAVEPMIDEHRDAIRTFIVERIHRWSAEEMTREMELSVGSDLQFIRYNGTAVGALIGGLIFAVLRLSSLLG
ncbi:DUF445 domain-containing protein [Lysobacter lacus]|uniref:DUF445 domain-containing protein n=2 Tax=Cognatilysobacter lacus TaxID=1643323 RepID=A0A5D8Z7B6_9GAMM|nr:DUF445 domain-containing protein [Lysobacter lacus]